MAHMMELKAKEDELHSKTIEHAEKIMPTIRNTVFYSLKMNLRHLQKGSHKL